MAETEKREPLSFWGTVGAVVTASMIPTVIVGIIGIIGVAVVGRKMVEGQTEPKPPLDES